MLKCILTIFIFALTFFIWSQERYPNGQIKSEGDQSNGIYTEYFENGKIRLKTDRRSFKLWSYRYEGYENGQAKVTNNIHPDSISYEHIEYYESGRLKEKGNCVVRFETNEKGDTSLISGKMDGLWTWYGSEGDSTYLLIDQGNYVGTGRIISHHFNGQVESNINYVDGKVVGDFFKYFESGQPEFTSKQLDDDIVENTRYYKNGNIESRYYYKDKIDFGESHWYYWDGALKTKTRYSAETGKPTESVEYWENGITAMTVYGEKGKSISYYYDEEGKLFKTSEIRSSNLLVITKFDKDGNKINKERRRVGYK